MPATRFCNHSAAGNVTAAIARHNATATLRVLQVTCPGLWQGPAQEKMDISCHLTGQALHDGAGILLAGTQVCDVGAAAQGQQQHANLCTRWRRNRTAPGDCLALLQSAA